MKKRGKNYYKNKELRRKDPNIRQIKGGTVASLWSATQGKNADGSQKV